MTQPDTISADYTLRPSEVAATLALLVEARQPAMLWGGPGTAKSMIAQQVATAGNRQYVDVRALLLDPVDLRGIPWRDSDGRTRWAPPVFLPPTDDAGLWLINLEELPSCVPMVQAALYQLALERKVTRVLLWSLVAAAYHASNDRRPWHLWRIGVHGARGGNGCGRHGLRRRVSRQRRFRPGAVAATVSAEGTAPVSGVRTRARSYRRPDFGSTLVRSHPRAASYGRA